MSTRHAWGRALQGRADTYAQMEAFLRGFCEIATSTSRTLLLMYGLRRRATMKSKWQSWLAFMRFWKHCAPGAVSIAW
jgi:hypothetical protein